MPSDFVAIIPARRASTRLPDKPLLDLGGKPMVVRTAERARSSTASWVVVATDDAAIMACCEEHGINAVLTRTDHATGTDRLAEAALLLGLADDSVVVNVQGDEPFIAPQLIDAVAAALHLAPHCAMATACHAITEASEMFNPNVVKVVRNRDGEALYFSRAPIPYSRDSFSTAQRSDLAVVGLRHVGIYAYRMNFLQRFPMLAPAPLERIEMLEQLRVLWHGERIACIESLTPPAPGVDTAEDLARARAFYSGIHN